MSYKLSKSKRIQAAVVLAIAALLVMTGTFAWYSFNQRRINTFNLVSAPNVNLHDDFTGGPEKDIYVENSGIQPALVRVRLTELLIQNGISLPENADDDETGTNWHAHTALENICEVCEFKAHEYFKWTMNGHKFYMPAPESAWGNGSTTEPKAVGDLDAIIDYAALLRNAFAGNQAVLEYIDEYLGGDASHAAELQAAIEAIGPDVEVPNVRQYDEQTEQLTRRLNEVRFTLIPSQITTMQDWLADKRAGDFWVMDEDGWCYWANPLMPGDATGQLLSSVDNIKNSAGEFIYRINVVLNATTVEGTELNDFFLAAESNGGITEDAKNLMLSVAINYIIGDDGNLYIDEGSGLYRQVIKDGDGGYIAGKQIFAGLDGKIGTGDDLAVGDKFSLDENGKIIVKDEGNDYIIESFEVGENGVAYIGIGGGAYFVPVDEDGNPNANGDRYSIAFAGENGIIGTEDDKGYEERIFYYIGSGVYVEVDSKAPEVTISEGNGPITCTGTVNDEKVTYFFSSSIRGGLYVVNNMNGKTVHENVKTAFFETLQIGEFYGFYRSSESMCIIYKDEEMRYHQDFVGDLQRTFTMKPLYKHIDGKLYFEASYELGDLGQVHDATNRAYPYTSYKGVNGKYYIKGLGADGEFGGQYFGVRVEHNISGGMPGVMEMPKVTAPNMGTGEVGNPYQIESRAEMEWITSQVAGGIDFAGEYFMVMNEFSMKVVDDKDTPGDTSDDVTYYPDFAPIGSNTKPFLGHFDGDSHTISDLIVNNSNNYSGLFGFVGAGGSAENVTLEDVSVSGNSNVGGIAGANLGTIDNCHVLSGTVNGVNSVGGVVGGIDARSGANSLVDNCTNYATVAGTGDNVGGIAGANIGAANSGVGTAVVQNCENNGDVTGSQKYTGGIVGCSGQVTALIENSHNKGKVNGVTETGGVVGSNGTNSSPAGSVVDCSNTGDVAGTGDYTGGVAGRNVIAASPEGGYIIGCYNTGTVSGANYVGGVAGHNNTNGTVQTSYNTGPVSGISIIGGVVGGNSNATLETSYNIGPLTGTGDRIGGVAGYNTGSAATTNRCFNVGNVEGRHQVGGVVGFNQRAIITNCYAQCDVTGTGIGNATGSSNNNPNGCAGGVVGYSYSDGSTHTAKINHVYFKGNVTGQERVGGIAGWVYAYTYSSANFGYAVSLAGTVDGTASVSGILGVKSGSVTVSAEYVVDTAKVNGAAVTGGTSVGAMTPAWWQNTVGFDFNNIWKWNNDEQLPVLIDVTP